MSAGERIELNSNPRANLGQLGERAACRSLCGSGWRPIARNARTRYGEIDVIAMDGLTLVFIEVKTLRGADRRAAERALESIGPRKRLQVRRLARAWLGEHRPPPHAEIRFDAIGVSIGAGSRTTGFVHVEAAF